MANKLTTLSEREISVMALLAQGKSNKEIGAILNLKYITVERRVSRIMSKIGIHNRVLLAFYSYSKGYVTNSDIKEAIQLERQKKW